MREIKFRGKRIDNGELFYGLEWVYGDLLQSYCDDKAHIDNNHCFDLMHIPANKPIEVEKETVGQFTGLLDKNGKEIYEGHIVLCNRHINDAFDKTTFLICVDEYFRYQGVSKLGNEISVEEFAYAEIIGNIHDNPELLK